ncbi:MAG: hybrid sensor histidine kinase/response regulator [Bacteroidales bacterium]|nr:hybrid sensor histidine kinase/response regulator [Bacteroidales bacterium]
MENNKDFKILVVDDTPDLLEITYLTLKKEKYTVFSAATGAECMRLLRKEKPHIILLDVILPDVNGKELAKKIKNEPELSDVYIILLSSLKTSSDYIAEGIEEGADGYIVRPVEKRELLARVAAGCRIIKAEEKLKNQNKELKKINAEKDKFFSIIAHDLKGPFSSILGFSDLLVEDTKSADSADVQHYAKIIQLSAKRAMDLLSNLMEWSQSQTGRMVFNPVILDLHKLINELLILFSSIAANKFITLFKDIPDNISVYADYSMFNTILRNLVSNAIKFSDSGGIIKITAREDHSNITIKVSDDGVGIPKKALDKLFQIDSDYTTPGTQNEKGTGLGLILCKEFVEKHGGKIWVESEEGKGSNFTFTIPIRS